MSGDEQIVGADHLSALLQVGPNLGVVNRRVVRQVKCFHVRQECGKRSGILSAPGRDLHAYSNSAFVTTDMQTSLTGTDCRRLSTSGCERFMMYEHVSVSNM